MDVREATSTDLSAVRNVLDAALLEPGVPDLDTAIADGTVLVAVRERTDGTVLGVLVLDDEEIAAVAVRRRRRGQGIGTALVDAATDRREHLVAEFRAGVRPFWESLGFDVYRKAETDRFRGQLS